MLGLCSLLTAQSVLNISGTVSNTDGSGSEGIFLTLLVDNLDVPFYAETNEEGLFEFAIDLDDNNTQGCFELFFFDCSFEAIASGDCYNPGNYDFNYDFIYCENGTDDCFAIVFSEVIDSGYLLNVLTFGVAPYTYIWGDGSTNESLVVPLGAEGEYCVTVTDSQGCETEACIDLTPPDPCFVNIFQEYNYNSLLLYAEGYGQTDELEYTWSTGETTQIIEVTESGEYCVTITDGLGCTSFDCGYFEIDTTWYEECFSYIYSTYEDSIETLNVESFGVAPFTYVWTLGDSIVSDSESYVPSESGVYCVTVTDAEGCVSTSCYDYFVWEECGVWIACDPTASGVLLWAFGYGAEPIQYTWSNGDEGPELMVTESGEYCVTIVDAVGCTSTACLTVNVEGVAECFTPIEVIEFPDYAVLTINPITDGEYEFYWSNGATTSSITVEESGTYCVEVLEISTGCFFTTCQDVYIGDQQSCWAYIETEYNDDSTAVLTVVAFDMNSDTMNFQYLWSTGEITESITVTEEGTYCVIIYGADGCTYEACTEVLFWDFPWSNSIFGFVYDADPQNPIDATIDLYSVLDDGSLELYLEGIETMEGAFVADNVDYGNYIALAVVEGGEYVPTYGYSTTSWESADVHQVGDNTAFVPLEISMIPIVNIYGNGSISGVVSTDNIVADDKGDVSRSGNPLEGANVMLMHSEVPVGQIFTNEEGEFLFSNLQYGTYIVVLEIPGYPRKTMEVTISEDDPDITDVEFETDFALTSTENISALSSLTLSPNPTSNTLVVDAYFTATKDVTYRVVDMNGRIIKSSTFKAETGENEMMLDVSTMDNGIYNLVLQSDEELLTKRFIKL